MMNIRPQWRPDPVVIWKRLVVIERKIIEGGDESDNEDQEYKNNPIYIARK